MQRNLLIVLILCMALITAGCGTASEANLTPDPGANSGQEFFTRVSYDELPQEIKVWVDASREMNLAQDKTLGNKRYILVTYGIKPTGGYTVEIEDVEKGAVKISVTVKFNQPTKDQYVTQAETRPYDIVCIEASDMPLEFFPVGDEYHVMTLIGVDELPSIVASSPGIKIFKPVPGDKTGGQLTISGVASVFEGTVLMRMESSEGRPLGDDTPVMAGMGDWYYFEVTMMVSDTLAQGSDYYLIVYTESPKDGSEDNVVQIPLEK